MEHRHMYRALASAAFLCAFWSLHSAAAAKAYRVVTSFGSVRHDGAIPYATVAHGPDGFWYGTTGDGGAVLKGGYCRFGCGTVFRMAASGLRTTIHNFSGPDGEVPVGPLLPGNDGWLYGTATAGGHRSGGTVYRLRTDGSVFQILHRFDPGRPFAGANPQGALIFGRDGLLYGTTAGGSGEPGLGVPEDMQQWAIAYRLRTDGRRFEVLHAFHLDDREGVPTDGLTQASDGRLYGTCGISTGDVLETIFRMNANGSDFKILHVFRGSSPFYQSPGVIEGVPGKLFGVTLRGEDSHGTIFSLALDGSGFEVLHRFHGDDGAAPLARLTLERDDLANRTKRVLLGTTSAGGKFGEGEVFALRANGSHFTVLHDFAGYPRDGQRPLAPLTLGDDGNFYGTTQQGGWNACAPFEGCGTVFNLRDEDVTL